VSQAAFYDSVASRYDALLASPIDAWTRDAFLSLVRETVQPSSVLLDFGCGTGVDAQWYVRHGYQVIAYDISPGMLEQLRARCAAEIARGEVKPASVLPTEPRVDAVVANFGVINAFSNPREFFSLVAPLLAPGAPLVISALNPFFWKDMASRWWWWALARSAWRAISSRGRSITTHRHFPRVLETVAAPAFRLESRAGVGAIVRRAAQPLAWDVPRTLAERLERRGWRWVPLRTLGLFVFLTFRRR
jgi:SAM-dependent methyltransferase